MKSNLKQIIKALRAKKSGVGWIAHCPAHDDQSPSLSISESESGMILYNCFAGCSYAEVIKALNIDDVVVRDAVQSVKAEVIEDFIARNMALSLSAQYKAHLVEERKLSEQVIEAEGIGQDGEAVSIPVFDGFKKLINIRLWTPEFARNDKSPKIKSYRNGTGKAVLYPVSQLKNEAILLCEGEMDALAAMSAGIPAISITGGAGSWNNDCSMALSGKVVTILYDNDQTGRNGAKKVATLLKSYPTKVLMAQWPLD